MTPFKEQGMTRQNTARLAGFFWFLAAAMGGFTIVYARNKLITFSDSAATFQKLQAYEQLFRESIAANILMAIFTFVFGYLVFEFFRNACPRLSRLFFAAIVLGSALAAVISANSMTALLVTSNAPY